MKTMPEGEPPPEDDQRQPRAHIERLTAFEAVLIAGGVLLFLVLLYEMQAFLSPLLVGAAGLILLWPLRSQTAVRALLLSGGFLLLLWFAAALSNVLIPFAVVYLLAYLFDPLVDYLQQRWRVPRWAASLGVAVLVLGVLTLLVVLLVPNVIGQIEVLFQRVLIGVAHLRDWLAATPLLDQLEAAGLIDEEVLLRSLNRALQEQSGDLAGQLPEAAEGIFRSLGSILGTITILAVVPVALYYTLKDYPVITARLVELFPTLGGRRDYLLHAGSIVGDYLRGQLTICAIAAFNVSVFLLIFGVPFALLIGLLAGLLNLIPNLGAVITNIIAVVIASIFGDPWLVDVLVVEVVLLGQALLEQSFLTPKILSYHVGLHPVLILLSLLVFGYLMGLFGLLIAVPATALLMTIYKAYRQEMTLELARSHRPPPPEQNAS